MHEADERERGGVQCVADGGVAAACVPADQAFFCEADAGQHLDALGERDVLGQDLNDI